MNTPEIIYSGKGKDRKIVITEDLKAYLFQCKNSKMKISKALGVSRPTLDLLYERCGIGKRETKKQRAVRKTAEQIVNAMQREEIKDQKEKQRAIKKVAHEIIRNKNLIDLLDEDVVDSEGKVLMKNGEVVKNGEAIDRALLALAGGDHNANLALRAQVLKLQVMQRTEEFIKKSNKMRQKLMPELRSRKQKMRKALESYGLWSGMMETQLDSWADAYLTMEMAKLQWQEVGCPMVETHVTAQAQLQDTPNQHFEAYNRAKKIFNECNQKLSTDLSKYQRMTGRSEEDNSFLSEMMEGLNKIGD